MGVEARTLRWRDHLIQHRDRQYPGNHPCHYGRRQQHSLELQQSCYILLLSKLLYRLVSSVCCCLQVNAVPSCVALPVVADEPRQDQSPVASAGSGAGGG